MIRCRKNAIVLVLVLATISQPGLAQQNSAASKMKVNVDIIGIKLGMTDPQVKAILEANDPKLEIVTLVNETKRVGGYAAFNKTCKTGWAPTKYTAFQYCPEYIRVAFHEGKVRYVGRSVVYSSENAPTMKMLEASLSKKYGPLPAYLSALPSYVSDAVFTISGAPSKSCSFIGNAEDPYAGPSVFGPDDDWAVSLRTNASTSNKTLAGGYQMQLADCRMMFLAVDAREKRSVEAERLQRDRENANAGGRTPKL